MDALHEQQMALEEEMFSTGVDRFRRETRNSKMRGAYTDTAGYAFVMRNLIEPTQLKIDVFMIKASESVRGVGHAAQPYMAMVPTDTLALIVTKVALNLSNAGISLTSAAVNIGLVVELEARLAVFEKEHKAYLSAVIRDLDSRTSNNIHKRHTLSAVVNKKGDNWVPWSPRTHAMIGMRLIDLFIAGTRAVEIHTFPKARNRTRLELRPSPALVSWVTNLEVSLEIYQANYWPTIVPPVPWTDINVGGYHSATIEPLGVIKNAKSNNKNKVDNLGAVLEALNLVQDTAWQINTELFAVLTECVTKGLPLGGLPSLEPMPIPNKPVDIESNKPARDRWRGKAAEAHRLNHNAMSKRVQLFQTMSTAKKFQARKAIYFPHQLDFRGRMYSVPTSLSPQGTDWNRSLLRFSEGKELADDRAVGWFFIHGANTFGIDKVALEARIAWVIEHSDEIIETATDPFEYRWWTEADKPWAFLAWAMEYAAWVRDTVAFKSHIPVAIDGSCNGIQHYSAILRDPIGGAAVNLVPAELPADIYTEVADVVNQKLEGIKETEPDGHGVTAEAWLAFGITRKITKRPVMVLPYGGTRHSCTVYVNEAVNDLIAGGTHSPFTDEELPKACVFLSGIVWESISEVVVAARSAMGWLRECAKVISDRGKGIDWAAPSGFIVTQAYVDFNKFRVKSKVQGHVFRLQLTEETNRLDTRRQMGGIAPNFIHSMDASALVATVNMAHDNGLNAFAVIHDSFGGHAADMDMLATCTREAFVDQYLNHDVLAEFRNGMADATFPSELPVVPDRGDLDVKEVLASPYFFA